VRRVGIILAAGRGSRLVKGDAARPLKPLTPVGGIPLLYRALRGLTLADCTRLIVVVGHGGEAIREAVERDRPVDVSVQFAYNALWTLKNGVSVLAAEREMSSDESTMVLTMADHLIGDEVWRAAGAHVPPSEGATLLIDRHIDAKDLDLDDATKVSTDGDRLVAIGKEISPYDAIDVGVFVCTRALLGSLSAVFAEGGDASLSEGVQRLADAKKMTVLDVGDGLWQDVDDERMLALAEARLSSRRA
jgi:1L-myo-inositol 1-phosphate cytidylyltransferase